MNAPAVGLACAALFAAMAGLCVAAPVLFRALACGALAASLWLLGDALGWEIAIPAWLGLGSAAAIASLYLRAVSRRAHRVAGAACGLAALAGAATMAAARMLS